MGFCISRAYNVIANPTVAKAATDKVVYLEVDEDAAYTIGLWNGFTGVTVNADMDDWTYKFGGVFNTAFY